MAVAVLLMVVAMTLVPLGDTAGKLMIAGGVSPYFVAWARFVVGAACLAPVTPIDRALWRAVTDWRMILRAALIAAGICAILTALRTEDIGSVFGAFFVGPMLSYILSILLLGERAGPLRAVLLAVGFAGVLLVVKPGFGMTAGLGFAVLAGMFYGCYLTANRWLAGEYSPRLLLFSQMVIGTVLLAPVLVIAAVPVLKGWILGLLILSGVASMLGNLLLAVAYGRASATRLAPFVYFQLVAATGFGWVVFSDLPDPIAAIGLMVILISGFATLVLRDGS